MTVPAWANLVLAAVLIAVSLLESWRAKRGTHWAGLRAWIALGLGLAFLGVGVYRL